MVFPPWSMLKYNIMNFTYNTGQRSSSIPALCQGSILFLFCKSPVLKTEFNGRGDPLRWPRDTLYPQKLVLTSPTSGGRSVGMVRLRTKSHGVCVSVKAKRAHHSGLTVWSMNCLRPLAVQPVARRYTDWNIPACTIDKSTNLRTYRSFVLFQAGLSSSYKLR
jgi:hypothetical protein